MGDKENPHKKVEMTPQRLKGFRDHMPSTMIVRQHVIDALRGIFEMHGFAPLETPAIEYAATLEGKYGEDERLLYRFEDQGKRRVGLRYDLTVPLARVVAMHLNDIQLPWKRYQISPVWRGDNPQFGRYREFYQCDVDIVGAASILADAEILSIYGEVMERLGFTDYRVLINHRKLMSGLAKAAGIPPSDAGSVFRALDKLGKIGREGVRGEMQKAGLPDQVVSKTLDLFLSRSEVHSATDNLTLLSELSEPLKDDAEAKQALADLRQLLEALPYMVAAPDRFRLDVTLARGLDYYTGPVYEVLVDEPKIGALGGGGRYDKLMSLFSGRDLPTTGGSFGLERIIDVMIELRLVELEATTSQALITLFDTSANSVSTSLELAGELRSAGVPCEVYLNPGDKLGKQFAYADRLGMPFAVVIGPDELSSGTVTVKSLKAPPPNQQTLPRAELKAFLLKRTREA